MISLETWMFGYLLNASWQIPVIFCAGWLAARIVRQNGLLIEHQIWVSALLLEVILPACHLSLGALQQALQALTPWNFSLGSASGDTRITTAYGLANAHGTLRPPSGIFVAVTVAYISSLLYFAVRLGWRLWGTHTMQRDAQRVSLTEAAAQSWERYTRSFNIHQARLAISPLVPGPVNIGLRRGVLLVPPMFLESLTEGDLEAVIAHEFAHMRRRDFAKNILYEALSLPIAFHPLLWLTRSRVAESREIVCDQIAASAVAGRERYARSLLRLASMMLDRMPAQTLHAIGIFDANIFERRLMNLTQRHVEVRGVRRFVIAATCAVVGLATCASALALRMDVTAPAKTSESQARPNIKPGDIEITYRKNPIYPPEAKAKKDTRNGPVVLAVTVGKDGAVEHIALTKSLRADYDHSALEAVKEWRWEPYLLNGQPVEIDTTVTVTYSLQP